MNAYKVNVRAVVRATCVDFEKDSHIADWEVYDFESVKKDADGRNLEVIVRCDQEVEVSGETEEEAQEMAFDAATGIEMDGWVVDDVDLWCDRSIDIEKFSTKEDSKLIDIK